MTNKFGTSADRHDLIRGRWGAPGHFMVNGRVCSKCGLRKPQRGGTTQNGKFFRCADCKNKGSILK